MHALPLELINLLGPTGLQFSQHLDGTLSWAGGGGMKPSGTGDVVLSAGQISLSDGREELVRTDAGRIQFQLEQGRLHSGKLFIPLTDVGNVDIKFSSPNIGLGPDAEIAGTADVSIRSTANFSHLFRYVEIRGGNLQLHAKLSGTVSAPALSSNLEISDGNFYQPSFGLHLQQVQLSGELRPRTESHFKGRFQAGEGFGDLNVIVDLTDLARPTFAATISGENLLLVDAPQINLVANPDFTVAWRPGQLTLNGRLIIPRARLSPKSLPSPSSDTSSDVVIVAGDMPYLQAQTDATPFTAIRGELEIGLGEDVFLETDIATIKFDGSARFKWAGGPVPVANGSYGMAGKLEAFGQLLRISKGSLRFADTAANNPYLNIRAERDIWGNSSIRLAGLYNTGTLRRPLMEAYTVPGTNKDRAQTLLVTGSDFDYEQGVGAVDVGMYIAPKIYVSYGIGLFNEESVISVRYDLRRGFGVKAATGEQENGVDLSYTIER